MDTEKGKKPKNQKGESEKKLVGRPAIVNADQAKRRLTEYFKSLEPEYKRADDGAVVFGEDGQPILLRPRRYPTTYGMTLALGYTHRSTFYEKKAKGELSDILSRADMIRLEAHEENLFGGKSQGSQFALRNAAETDDRWVDRVESNANATVEMNVSGIPASVMGILSAQGIARPDEDDES